MELIKRIEECLENGWAVEAEDIRALVEAYKDVSNKLDALEMHFLKHKDKA